MGHVRRGSHQRMRPPHDVRHFEEGRHAVQGAPRREAQAGEVRLARGAQMRPSCWRGALRRGCLAGAGRSDEAVLLTTRHGQPPGVSKRRGACRRLRFSTSRGRAFAMLANASTPSAAEADGLVSHASTHESKRKQEQSKGPRIGGRVRGLRLPSRVPCLAAPRAATSCSMAAKPSSPIWCHCPAA